MKGTELEFKLKTPCNDCPFAVDSAPHEGICSEAAQVMNEFVEGRMAHSCHKTDPRAECEDSERVAGPVQHCAGALIMAHRAGKPQEAMLVAELMGKFKPKRLSKTARVHTPMSYLLFQLTHMLEHAARFIGPRTKVKTEELVTARAILEAMNDGLGKARDTKASLSAHGLRGADSSQKGRQRGGVVRGALSGM